MPWNVLRPSLSAAIFIPRVGESTMPRNFSVIGGGGGGPGGGGGGPLTGGCTTAGRGGAGGGGGGALGLKRNRFRSVVGFNRSAFSDSRCTSGALMPCGSSARIR